ncbi:MAG: hypothetical protein NVS1B14_13200 [Vulcanimicrobiaceae bacterium]
MASVRASTTPSMTASRFGATHPWSAAPGSIRADVAQHIGRNMVHGSDSHESAERELKIFFNENEFVSRKHDMQRWLVEK